MGQSLRGEIFAPSQLGNSERARWCQLLDGAGLPRAFLTYEFALACEVAYGKREVGVLILHRGGEIQGFFPFQFPSRVHEILRSAVRIGEEMSDCAGVIAAADLRVTPADLLRAGRLSALAVTHLPARQETLTKDGAPGQNSRVTTGHLIDLSHGPDRYIAELKQKNSGFVQDTLRRAQKLEREVGSVEFICESRATWDAVREVIDEKRRQYSKTDVSDIFAFVPRLKLMEALCSSQTEYCTVHFTGLATKGKFIARHVGLKSKGVMNYWFPVYDPAVKKYSPGRQLLWNTISRPTEDAIVLIDRGEGDTQAKRDFSTHTQEFVSAYWYGSGPRSFLSRTYASLLWRLSR